MPSRLSETLFAAVISSIISSFHDRLFFLALHSSSARNSYRFVHSFFSVLKYLSRAKKFLKKPVKVFGILCPKKVILQLVNMAKKIHQFMDNARAEWEMEGDTIYLNDLSFEKNEITDKVLVQKQISWGR